MSGDSIKNVLNLISSEPSVLYSEFQVFDKFRASGFVITKSAPVCRLISSMNGVCKNCLLTSANDGKKAARWKVILSGKTLPGDLLAKLESKGLKASIVDGGEVRRNGLLTFKQEKVVKLASDEGYFKFPRKIGLKKLSEMLAMSPSTLDEVLRRAESKIVKTHVGSPNGTSEET
ncbi:MAG: helix-turn-helix domain-containing protein [Nitrososphaerota archaeon]|nr:helix-turn-helix domain-containing protein [Nitrososphaerota archaeon]